RCWRLRCNSDWYNALRWSVWSWVPVRGVAPAAVVAVARARPRARVARTLLVRRMVSSLEDISEPGVRHGPVWLVMGCPLPMTSLADRLLPDQLWQCIQPLLPPPPSHARGGAPRTVPDRACTAAISLTH